MSDEDCKTITRENRHMVALGFGIGTAILAGLILAPPAMEATGTTAALRPPMFIGAHTTCCPDDPR